LDRRLFFKVFGVVAVLVILTFVILNRTNVAYTNTDIVGASISSIIFSYLLHLWLLPGEEPPEEGE